MLVFWWRRGEAQIRYIDAFWWLLPQSTGVLRWPSTYHRRSLGVCMPRHRGTQVNRTRFCALLWLEIIVAEGKMTTNLTTDKSLQSSNSKTPLAPSMMTRILV